LQLFGASCLEWGGDPNSSRLGVADHGLVIGFIPAILLIFAFPIGVVLYALIAVGFVYPRARAFAYGAVCSLHILPGLGLGIWAF
jgi:hypothetical protein